MQFEECDISGQLHATGLKGDYWIDDQVWAYLTLVTTDSAGVNSKSLGQFYNVENAKAYAVEHDTIELIDD